MAQATAIEVRDLQKTFALPRHKVHTLKGSRSGRFTHCGASEWRSCGSCAASPSRCAVASSSGWSAATARAKHPAEVLAGIYPPDSGKIRVSGRLAPIELGIGFRSDLTARDNVVVNAAMMGITPRQARRRFHAIMEFAELGDFVDLKLKNYSSGMLCASPSR